MAKKVFYNRRYKMPGWGQLYAVWATVALVVIGILFFTSVEKVSSEGAAQLPTALNGFAEGLFYELRDADAGGREEVILAHAKRLEKKHGYKIREERNGSCKTLRLMHGKGLGYGVATTVADETSQGAFAVLTFLDRVALQNTAVAIEGRLLFTAKGCDSEAAMVSFAGEGFELPVILQTGDANAHYDRIPEFKNLKLRRYFEQAFLSRERTLWANTMAMLAGESVTNIVLPVKAMWSASPEVELQQSPLLKHPAAAKDAAEVSSQPVALYLAADYQLHRGGFFILTIVFWLLAFIPFANALGTFREKLELGSALTSAVLYGFAFFGYLMLVKLILGFAKSDMIAALFSLFLLPVMFIPVRILQKNVLRAELNRAGLHILVQLLLTIALFFNPLPAFIGLICLMLVSGFSRADIGRKALRFVLLLLVFAAFFFATRQPLGSFTTFLSQLLPGFSVAGIFKLLLVAFVGGNLVSLFFVPRERV